MIRLSLLPGHHALLSLRRIALFAPPLIPRPCTPSLSVIFHSLGIPCFIITQHVRMIAIRLHVLGLG